LTSPARR